MYDPELRDLSEPERTDSDRMEGETDMSTQAQVTNATNRLLHEEVEAFFGAV